MTKFGKILVLVNLTISLMMMIWAASLFAYGMHWSDNPAKDGKPDGELVKRTARAKAAWLPLSVAERNLRTAQQNLLTTELQRRDSHFWYDYLMGLLEKDANPKAPTALTEVATDVNGQPENDPLPDAALKYALRLKMKPATDFKGKQPLTARNLYDFQETELFDGSEKMPDGLKQLQTTHSNALKENIGWVTQMLGPKGLHERLQYEKHKREGVEGEKKKVEPLLINTAASSQFALEREKELRARVEELEERRDELRRKLGMVVEKSP